jgi:mono/diheme cytochrome c family protein
MFSTPAIVRLLAACLIVPATAGAAEPAPPSPAAPVASPLPAPPTPPPAQTADPVTQPFRPAVRVPQSLPVTTAFTILTNLAFDAEVKEQKLEPGVFETDFAFNLTNVSPADVQIIAVRTSCGCTVAKLPDMPWTLAPGATGSFGIHMDLRGKHGAITKSVLVSTDRGNKTVYVRGIIPDMPAMSDNDRKRNLMIAKADRQAVFKGDCASCHATPTFGKTGSQLYEAACGICHEGAHRNEMVPDLNVVKQARDYEYWRKWIAEGKDGTLMPGFARAHGGPLTDAQILSLAHYLTRRFPNPNSLPVQPPIQNVPASRPPTDSATVQPTPARPPGA